MKTIEKNRVLRTLSRKPESTYKVDTSKVLTSDTLIINISDENDPNRVLFKYKVDGSKLANKDSIHFKAVKTGNKWSIIWLGGIEPLLMN